MNQKNVAALSNLIGNLPYEITVRDGDLKPIENESQVIAEFLAARGVVAASALTGEDFQRIERTYRSVSAAVGENEFDGTEGLQKCQQELVYIASERKVGNVRGRTTEDTLYLVWSFEHDSWWGPDHRGYVPTPAQAGLYTREEAEQICKNANFAPGLLMETFIPEFAL